MKDYAQYQPPNFIKGRQLYLIRCFECDNKYGKENWAPAVATGQCAWCGWKGDDTGNVGQKND